MLVYYFAKVLVFLQKAPAFVDFLQKIEDLISFNPNYASLLLFYRNKSVNLHQNLIS